MAAPEEKTRKNAQWKDFVEAMSAYYKPTENITLKHFHFRSNIQKDGETFIAFCNRVLLEAKHCNFKCIYSRKLYSRRHCSTRPNHHWTKTQ